MKKKRRYAAGILCLAFTAVCLTACGNTGSKEIGTEIIGTEGNDYAVATEEVRAEKATLRDKVLGAWIGHVLGLGSGYEYLWTEDGQPWIAMDDKYWEPDGNIVSGTLGVNALRVGPYEENYQRVFQGMVKSDDDCHIDIFNQWIMEEYGPSVGYYELTEAWKNHKIADAAGGEEAVRVIDTNNYIAPYTGMYAFGNTKYTATEPWIENETLGMLFPYMPVRAESTADVFTSISGDSYGVYLGKLCAIAYSYALTEDSAPKALEKAFTHMERSNIIYDAYEYVLKCYAENPDDWRACVKGLVERSKGHNLMKLNTQIDLYVNAGFIFTGVVFGENDFEKSIKITALSGYDGDCTTATVGGLLGAVKGYSGLPEKYRQYLDGESVYQNDTQWFANIGADYPEKQTFNEITDLTMRNMEAQILAGGGSVNGETYLIKKQNYTGKVQTEVLNYGFDEQTTEPWLVEGPGKLALTETAHTGLSGGGIRIEDYTKDVKVYQSLKLTKGDYYQVVLYVSAELGKEFRIYAQGGDEYVYRSYSTPIMSLDRFVRAELVFCATSETMNIGIHIPTQTNASAFFAIDDMAVLNISHKVARTGESLEGENAEGTKNVRVVSDETASGKAAAVLQQGDAIRFQVKGLAENYQNIRVYYSNKGVMSTVKVTVDDSRSFCLPLMAQGETSGFSSGNFTDFGIFLGEGEHEVVLRLDTDGEIEIDKIEIRMGDISQKS